MDTFFTTPIDKACNPEGEPEVLYDRLLRAYLKEDDRFAGMTPWYASDEQVGLNEQRDELNTDRVENEAFDDGNNATNDRSRNSENAEHGEGAAALPAQQNFRANDAYENNGGVANHTRIGNTIPVVTTPTTTTSTTTTTGMRMTTSVAASRLHSMGGPIPSIWAHQPPPQSGFDFFREREFTGLRFRQPIRIISQQRETASPTQGSERHGLESRERRDSADPVSDHSYRQELGRARLGEGANESRYEGSGRVTPDQFSTRSDYKTLGLLPPRGTSTLREENSETTANDTSRDHAPRDDDAITT